MDGNGAVNVCSWFCLNAQLSGNQNVRVVGTSHRITWLFPYSQRGEGRKNKVKGNTKGFPAFWNLCTIKPFHLFFFFPCFSPLHFCEPLFGGMMLHKLPEHLKLYWWVLNVPKLISEYEEQRKMELNVCLYHTLTFQKEQERKYKANWIQSAF